MTFSHTWNKSPTFANPVKILEIKQAMESIFEEENMFDNPRKNIWQFEKLFGANYVKWKFGTIREMTITIVKCYLHLGGKVDIFEKS